MLLLEEEMLEAQPLHQVLGEDDFLMNYQADNELLAAASSQLAGQQRLDAAASWAPGTPVPAPEPPQAQAQLSGTINNTYVYARLGDVGQGARRSNSMPRTPRRSRSPAPLTIASTPRPALPPGLPELPQPQEGQVPAFSTCRATSRTALSRLQRAFRGTSWTTRTSPTSRRPSTTTSFGDSSRPHWRRGHRDTW